MTSEGEFVMGWSDWEKTNKQTNTSRKQGVELVFP